MSARRQPPMSRPTASLRSPDARNTQLDPSRLSFGSPKPHREAEVFEARYTALSGLISDLNVYSVSKALTCQKHLGAVLGDIALSLDKHMMSNDKSLVDRVITLEHQTHEEAKILENLRIEMANKIASLLGRIDIFAEQYRTQAASALDKAKNRGEQNVIDLKKVVTEEKNKYIEIRSDEIHRITQRVATVAEIVESEALLFEEQKNSLVNDIRSRLEILESLVHAEDVIKNETSKKIQDIMRQTEEDLLRQFESERHAQKESKDRVKRLIYTIHRRIQQA